MHTTVRHGLPTVCHEPDFPRPKRAASRHYAAATATTRI